MTAKPFHVLRCLDAATAAAHYERLAERSRVNLDHLYEMAREFRTHGSSEVPVGHWETREDAEQDRARRDAADRLPGVTYRVEYLDVSEDWWTS